MFGAEDFCRELSLPLRREGEARDLVYARSSLVTAAAAAHVQSVDGVWPDLQEMEGLKTFALQSRRLGFSGMSLIHPSQIEHVNAAFTPSADEIDPVDIHALIACAANVKRAPIVGPLHQAIAGFALLDDHRLFALRRK